MGAWQDDNPIHIETNHGSVGDPDWANEVREDGTLKGDDGQIVLWREGEGFYSAEQYLSIHVDEIEFIVQALRKARGAIRREQGKAIAKIGMRQHDV